MPAGDKPYRVYRGGRTRGKVPLAPKPGRTPVPERDGRSRYPGVGPKPRRKGWSRRRKVWVAVGLLFLVVVVWLVAGYLAFRGGVADANRRLSSSARAALSAQSGLLLSKPTDILLLGTDHAATPDRRALEHSDSIMLVRSDPGHHRIVYLSIMRDLRVDIPGYGVDKVNAAYQRGGPALAIRTVRTLTGLPVNHVVLVDFANFKDVIDKLGGVDINVPTPIISNRFDCPYRSDAKCQRWQGWHFGAGKQHMNGQRALIYSRIRENRLGNDSDATRVVRQQQVLQALSGKLSSFGTMVRLPFVGGDLLKPLATDLSAGQFLQLGWLKFRGHTLQCRLGGSSNGGSYLLADEESRAVIAMVKGQSAPQPPPPGSPYGSGCFVGSRSGG